VGVCGRPRVEAYFADPKEVLVSVALEIRLVQHDAVLQVDLVFASLAYETGRGVARSVGIFQVAKVREMEDGVQCQYHVRATIGVLREGRQVERASPCRDQEASVAEDVTEENILAPVEEVVEVVGLVEVKEIVGLAEVKEVEYLVEVKEVVYLVEVKEVVGQAEVKVGWVEDHPFLYLEV